jgi:hypothetical protein
MKLLTIFFQYSSIKIFEPLNVYEKCKVFMCSMRCSDNRNELICMIRCLNKIILNKETKKEMRIILLKEHLTYLLKLTSSSSNHSNNLQQQQNNQNMLNENNFFSINTDDGLELIKSILDLLDSMVFLMSGKEETNNEQDTLSIYVHILGTYLTEPGTFGNVSPDALKRSYELNDFVIKKIINLGVNYKSELKQVLEKWPNLKTKIGNALKSSTQNASNNSSGSSSNSINANMTKTTQANKAPKIALNFNFSKK